MELLQLKYFCDAAQTENFSKTAKKFQVPASDISQSIKRLEKELGAELFSRRANRVMLNEQGRCFYQDISKALDVIDAAKDSVRDSEERGKIRLCINTNRRFLFEVMEKYRKRYPDVNIEIKHFSDTDAEHFDIIIDSDSDSLSSYKKQLLISESIMLAAKREAFDASLDGADLSALASLPFITMGKGSNLYTLTNSICESYGFKPHTVIQSDDPLYVQKCVELGLGVTFAPAFSWQGFFSENILLKRIDGFERKTYIYTEAHGYMPKRVKMFIELLINEARLKTII